MTAPLVLDEHVLWELAHSTDNYWGERPIDHFEAHIEIDWLFNCWRWTGHIRRGYGGIQVGKHSLQAHRFSYELHRGSAFGLILDHLCQMTWCVNPWHLEPVTISINTRRMRAFRSANMLEAGRRRGTATQKAKSSR